jgi:hypothetical protein
LLVGISDRRVLVSRILQFNNSKGEAVDEDDDIGPPVMFVFDDGELIDGEPVVIVLIFKSINCACAPRIAPSARYSTVTPSTSSR